VHDQIWNCLESDAPHGGKL